MNNYIRYLLAASVMATALVPAVGAAAPEVYGKLMVGYETVDDETQMEDFWQSKSYASRFGVRGSAETDYPGIEAVYGLEWEVDVSDQANSSADHIKARNQFVGLKGGAGKVIVGRYDTPFKAAQGKVDLYNDFEGDIKVLMLSGEIRSNNILQYTSPKIADSVEINLMAIPGEDGTGVTDRNGPADGTSMSVTYDSDNLYVAFAVDSEVAIIDSDASRIVAIWKAGNFGIGGLFQTSDYAVVNGGDEEVTFLSAYYKVGKFTLKAQVGSTDNFAGDDGDSVLGTEAREAELTVLGVDWNLSKKTILGFHTTSREGGALGVDPISGDNNSRDVTGFNLIHSFE
jgi:predicted porin